MKGLAGLKAKSAARGGDGGGTTSTVVIAEPALWVESPR